MFLPICETILFPALVQGESAKESIVRCIKEAENYDLDVVLKKLKDYTVKIIYSELFVETITLASY